VKRLQAFKFELRPSGEQQRNMRRFAGCCRFVYNQALALQTSQHEAGGKFIGYVTMANQLPEWKQEFAWLRESPSQTLQQTLKNLERAYQNFFEKRADLPRKKKRGRGDSFRYPQGFEIDPTNSRIKLPKLGWIRYRNSRQILGLAKNITVSLSGGKWFASIQTEREVEQLVPVATSAVGIDVGIARFATFSDASFLAPLNSFRKHEQRLRRYQRMMSRKVKFSQNWQKARRRVQKIHTRIGNVRRDFLHKATTTIAKNHGIVCIENLQVRNMSQSSKGSAKKAGKNVAAKSGLNKSILDQGWFEFRRQLEYKLNWTGGMLLAVPAHHTSQTCPCCGHVAKENRLTQSQFLCVECGYENNADVVGAINILSRGIQILRDEGQDTADASAGYASTARIACREEGSGFARKRKTKPASMKREPTEETQAIAA
jgi:putative transposase